MPKPFALVSSSDIKGQAFLDVVRAVGGVIEDAKDVAEQNCPLPSASPKKP